MDSRNLFKTIFGKENNITELDIKEKILTSFKENSFFECKRIERIAGVVIQKTDPRSIIIPELVAFLNKVSFEGGVLALGIEAKEKIPTKILGVDESLIKGEGSLRDWIVNDIVSIPKFLDYPTVEIETINLQNGKKVFLIEIHPQDTNVVYYYGNSECAYKREVDETKKISLDETFRLAKEKCIAKTFVSLEDVGFKEQDGIVTRDIKVVYRNSGTKPAHSVCTIFLFKISEKDNCEINYPVHGIVDVTGLNTCFKCYQREFKGLFYPGRSVVDGQINVKFKEAATITLSVEIDEEEGTSVQIFLISKQGVNPESKNFKTYI
jgi:hypothetical protein